MWALKDWPGSKSLQKFEYLHCRQGTITKRTLHLKCSALLRAGWKRAKPPTCRRHTLALDFMCRDKVCIVCPIKEIKPVGHSQWNELWNEWWLAEQAGARTKAYANCSAYLKTLLLPDHQFTVQFGCSWAAFELGCQINRRNSIPPCFSCLLEQEWPSGAERR